MRKLNKKSLLSTRLGSNDGSPKISRTTTTSTKWLLGVVATFFLTSGVYAQNYCPAPNNSQYGNWADQQAASGSYRVCKATTRNSGVTVRGNVNGQYGGAELQYQNQTSGPGWRCNNRPPQNGQEYYIHDRRSGLNTAPRKYRGQ